MPPSSEKTHKIVVDSSNRITALPDDTLGNPRPLKIGDRIFIDRIDKGGYRGYVKKPPANGKSDDYRSRVGQRLRQPSNLLKHAIETFGSEKMALIWLVSECGVLNNETPTAFIEQTGNEAEVERILGCIDYGMIA
jgi:uncharacterized protein (DUF2384 family)